MYESPVVPEMSSVWKQWLFDAGLMRRVFTAQFDFFFLLTKKRLKAAPLELKNGGSTMLVASK